MEKTKQLATNGARIALGLIFFGAGLNGFFNFLPMPPPEDAVATFMGGLAAAGYFFPLLKATEVAIGVALLGNRFVPLALAILAPISINILAFHLALAPAGLPLAAFIIVAQLSLAWVYRDSYRALLTPRAQPRFRRHVGLSMRRPEVAT